ncbi:GyrI-like domain-containing protein [Mucilaginibacter sp. FT3.2]|uniref:GyrI-like domain-containing protein n=1 Tax=Mucilaginibacter sp. FT3.2 TaxID=2723090 RepID=UPI0016109996|nr:GyrI-like domain-containing protein [Mucilaginibacter sp. FT3.2]MBB6231526.1 effector-binding domain-containing protein [Mucilaginibacter sp. FT3.2]
MKKAIIAVIVLIVIGFIPFQQKSIVNIKAGYFDVCQQLLLAGNWIKWQPDINNTPPQQVKTDNIHSGFLITIPNQVFKMVSGSANTFDINTTITGVNYHYLYTVVPRDIYNNGAVIITANTNLFKWLITKFKPNEKPDGLIQNLKAFMENAKLYYGFTIKEKNVAETYMAVKKETILLAGKYPQIGKAFNDLNSFIAQKNIKATQPISGTYYLRGKDSIQMLIGISINKEINSGNGIAIMRMPAGKVVIGDYKGKYGERQKIYNAMEKYIQDNFLAKQVAPYERYLDNKLPAGDNDTVNMQVNYPVL